MAVIWLSTVTWPMATPGRVAVPRRPTALRDAVPKLSLVTRVSWVTNWVSLALYTRPEVTSTSRIARVMSAPVSCISTETYSRRPRTSRVCGRIAPRAVPSDAHDRSTSELLASVVE